MLAEKTGWSYHYILHRMSWINLRMMLADAPSYRSAGSCESGLTEETPATDTDLQTLAHTLNAE